MVELFKEFSREHPYLFFLFFCWTLLIIGNILNNIFNTIKAFGKKDNFYISEASVSKKFIEELKEAAKKKIKD